MCCLLFLSNNVELCRIRLKIAHKLYCFEIIKCHIMFVDFCGRVFDGKTYLCNCG